MRRNTVSASGRNPVAGFSEDGNEHPVATKA
jgi:hypothetical protein